MERVVRQPPKPKPPNLDGLLRQVLADEGWAVSVPWFLIASYLYYQKNQSVITDECFDWLCLEMKIRWRSIRHRHKTYIDHGMVVAGTGFAIPFDKLPLCIKGAAHNMYKRCYGKDLPASP